MEVVWASAPRSEALAGFLRTSLVLGLAFSSLPDGGTKKSATIATPPRLVNRAIGGKGKFLVLKY